MEAGFREALPFHGGSLIRTVSHLSTVNNRGLTTASFELTQIANLRVEEQHSFRHRAWGMFAAAVLLIPSVWSLFLVLVQGNIAVLGTHLGLAILCGLFFGTLFLYGVLASRRIPWLCLSHNGAQKLIALPGVEKHEVETFLGLGGRSAHMEVPR